VLLNTKDKRIVNIFSIRKNNGERDIFLDNAANEKVRVIVARSIDILVFSLDISRASGEMKNGA